MTTWHLSFPPVGMTTIDGKFIPYNNPIRTWTGRCGNYLFTFPANKIGFLAVKKAMERLCKTYIYGYYAFDGKDEVGA